MPKTKAKIQEDFYFQGLDDILKDIVEFLDDDDLIADREFLTDFQTIDRIIVLLNNDQLSKDKQFVFLAPLVLEIIENLSGGGSVAVPDAIDDLASSSQTSTSITLTWTAPADNGASITDYTVQYRVGTSGAWSTFADAVSGTTGVEVTGLTTLTNYQFQVAAVNSEGTGSYSNVVTQATAAPFTNDSNTFFYDLTSTQAQNTVNSLGDDTLYSAPCLLGNGPDIIQISKDHQPLVDADGINCNQDTARQMTFDIISQIANGTEGWYLIVNAFFTASESHLINIARAASTTPSRGQAYTTSSRNVGVKADENEGGAVNWLGYTPQIVAGDWTTMELRLRADGTTTPPLQAWLDTVLQTLTAEDSNTFAQFAATSPSEVILFNDTGDANSFNGKIKHVGFVNENASDAIRSSMSTYFASIRPSN